MRILVVEDEVDVARAISRLLGRSGFAIDHVVSIDEACAVARVHTYDLVLLDRRLPDGDGLGLLPRLRCEQPGVRVVILTACGAKDAVVEGLDAGADDYLTKPFDSDELMARIRASLRRSGGSHAPPIKVGEISYDPNLRDVVINGESILIHGRELTLLEVLLRNCGRMAPREAIMEEIYGFADNVQESALNSLVMRLRRRLDDRKAGVKIHMARGVGYMLTKADK
ncbi:response regulator transcription factor [Methylocystis heyeri]|uniref:Response regulator n=1 Tax=Methylocystis heyeri TaxID=391905 RepID=A0A6B8KJP4_9HYPH|nr:response regulator transcription factor [Methylocystis heyeri]QGM46803.1 response regulator [Methylocystis heyeri]